jgi:hypothetical protein
LELMGLGFSVAHHATDMLQFENWGWKCLCSGHYVWLV